jgi:hypothetical protein
MKFVVRSTKTWRIAGGRRARERVGRRRYVRDDGEEKEEDQDEEERTYPLETSQTLIVLSRLAETNLSPSCVNLTVDIL